MVNRVSPQAVLLLFNLLKGTTPITKQAPPVRAVILGAASDVENDFSGAATVDAISALDLYNDGGAGPYRADATVTMEVSGSVLLVKLASGITFTSVAATGDGGTADLAKYVLLYLVQEDPESDGSSIPFALFQPDFVGTPPDGTNYALTFPTTGAIRLETA